MVDAHQRELRGGGEWRPVRARTEKALVSLVEGLLGSGVGAGLPRVAKGAQIGLHDLGGE